jgi:hypothetical protein
LSRQSRGAIRRAPVQIVNVIAPVVVLIVPVLVVPVVVVVVIVDLGIAVAPIVITPVVAISRTGSCGGSVADVGVIAIRIAGRIPRGIPRIV